jgi:hypothetical protein
MSVARQQTSSTYSQQNPSQCVELSRVDALDHREALQTAAESLPQPVSRWVGVLAEAVEAAAALAAMDGPNPRVAFSERELLLLAVAHTMTATELKREGHGTVAPVYEDLAMECAGSLLEDNA